MKQLSQNLRTGKLSVDEVPLPGLAAGQVLVQAAYSLISAGTERTRIETGRKSLLGKALSRPDQVRQVLRSMQQVGLQATYQKVMTKMDARSPLGYCASGTIIGLGAGVTEFHTGQRVACGGGSAAHAEFFTAPINLCAPVPDNVSLEDAAFTTLGAVAMQGVRLAEVSLGETVVVLGLGLLGQLTVQILKAAGCQVAGFDPNRGRCELALQLGADHAVDSGDALRACLDQLSNARGADAVLITAGTSSNRPVEMAGELCRDKGRVVVVGAVGLAIPREPYYHKELTLNVSRSYGPGRYDPVYEEKGHDYPYGYVRWTEQRNMQSFLALIAAGKVKVQPLVSHRFPLDQAEDAYVLIRGQLKTPSLGVLFDYSTTPLVASTRIEMPGKRPVLSTKLGVGVIGAGNFAQSMLLPHLKNNPQVELQAVYTLAPLEARDVAERFGFRTMASDVRDILDDANIQAVIIATRHDSHAGLAMRALQAGKAVHLEKPLALDLMELEELQAAYRQQAVAEVNQKPPFIMVGFNRRFAPMVQALQRYFAGHQEPMALNFTINAGSVPLEHWVQDAEQGGGRIVGEACHFVDLVQYIAGAKIVRVAANAMPDLGKYRGDNVALTLTCASGSIATLLYVANGDRAMSKETLQVFCGGKVAVIDDYVTLTTYANNKRKVSHRGKSDKGHKAEVEAWIQAIRQGQPEPVPFADAIDAMRATFAIQTALSEQREVAV